MTYQVPPDVSDQFGGAQAPYGVRPAPYRGMSWPDVITLGWLLATVLLRPVRTLTPRVTRCCSVARPRGAAWCGARGHHTAVTFPPRVHRAPAICACAPVAS